MRKIIPIFFILPIATFAAAPTTQCPAGYITLKQPWIQISKTGTCPAGYTTARTLQSCLVASPGTLCGMYVPKDATYSDDSGTYLYAVDCPLDDD